MSMKKTLKALSLAAVVTATGFSLQSCEKLKDAIFPAFVTQAADIEFTVPAITVTGTGGIVSSTTTHLKLDSIIQAETHGVFSIDNVSAVRIEDMTLTVLNPDASNNLSNFQQGTVSFSSNANQAATQIGTSTIADVFASSLIDGTIH